MVLAAFRHLNPAVSSVTLLLSSSSLRFFSLSLFFCCCSSRGFIGFLLIFTAAASASASFAAEIHGVVHVVLGVQSGASRVHLGVPEALARGVAIVTGSGSEVHDFMEHGHSEPLGLVFLLERQGADTDVHLHVPDLLASGAHDISKNSGSASTTFSLPLFAAHDVVVTSPLVLHEIHGVLVPALDVLVVVGRACPEPLLEAFGVLVPAFVGSSDELVSS